MTVTVQQQRTGRTAHILCLCPTSSRPLEEAEKACSLITSKWPFCARERVGTVLQREQAGSQNSAGSS